MHKSKGFEQQHWLASGYVLWTCKNRVPDSNSRHDTVTFWPVLLTPIDSLRGDEYS